MGILEGELHGAAQRPQVLVAEALDGLAVEADGALGRQQAKEGEAEGGLAGAALAHDADGVALAHGNRYAVDGAHMIEGALQHAFLYRQPDLQIGRAACWERVCKDGETSGVAVSLKKKN